MRTFIQDYFGWLYGQISVITVLSVTMYLMRFEKKKNSWLEVCFKPFDYFCVIAHAPLFCLCVGRQTLFKICGYLYFTVLCIMGSLNFFSVGDWKEVLGISADTSRDQKVSGLGLNNLFSWLAHWVCSQLTCIKFFWNSKLSHAFNLWAMICLRVNSFQVEVHLPLKQMRVNTMRNVMHLHYEFKYGCK